MRSVPLAGVAVGLLCSAPRPRRSSRSPCPNRGWTPWPPRPSTEPSRRAAAARDLRDLAPCHAGRSARGGRGTGRHGRRRQQHRRRRRDAGAARRLGGARPAVRHPGHAALPALRHPRPGGGSARALDALVAARDQRGPGHRRQLPVFRTRCSTAGRRADCVRRTAGTDSARRAARPPRPCSPHPDDSGNLFYRSWTLPEAIWYQDLQRLLRRPERGNASWASSSPQPPARAPRPARRPPPRRRR